MRKFVIKKKGWLKALFIIIFIFVVAFNVTIITIGTNSKLTSKIYSLVVKKAYVNTDNVKIDKLTFMHNINYLPANKEICINVSAPGVTEPGLRFKSLTPDVFELTRGSKYSYVKTTYENDGTPHKGKLRIYSINDSTFVKDYEITFRDNYQKDFSVITKRCGAFKDGFYTAYVGTPIYFSYDFSDITNKKEVEIIYNEDEFDKITNYQLVPKKAGQFSIKYRYYDLYEEEFKYNVIENTEHLFNNFDVYESVTQTKINSKLECGETYYLMPTYNGKLIYEPYELESSDETIISFTQNRSLVVNDTGNVTITIKAKDCTISKELVIDKEVAIPYFSEQYYDKVTNTLRCKVGTEISEWVYFTKSGYILTPTLEYDHDYFELSVKESSSTGAYFYFEGKKAGETILKLIYSNETESKTKTINIEVFQNGLAIYAEKLKMFFVKGSSHMALFMITGMATLMFVVFAIYKAKKWFKIVFISLFGLILGLIEEFIQLFMKGRTSSLVDAFVYDWMSYLFGLLVAGFLLLSIVQIIRYIRIMRFHALLRKNNKNEKLIEANNFE